jgi:bifunctional DNase/RNase
MSRRVEVFIKNILPAHSHGAYTLVLHNPVSKIQLPVLIGAIEAQSIVMELEGLQSARPLTHDLFLTTLQHFHVAIKEICVVKLSEGIYYSTILFSNGGGEIAVDSRTSDAIALAMKFKAPIFVLQEIIDEAGYTEEDSEDDLLKPGRGVEEGFQPQVQLPSESSPFAEFDLEELDNLLQEAISVEDYVRAARIRDEIAKRK